MSLVLLGCVLLLALCLVPLGLPGLWVMIIAALAYDWLVPAASVGWVTVAIAVGLAVLAEVLEFTLSARYTQKYGGSRRAAWGSILGGIAGAIVGVPVPIVGSVIGAFAGAFVGALVLEYTRPDATRAGATRVATGALLGRVAAAAAKTGLGCAVAVTLMIGAAA
ncbi:MAG: DUF456 domain-containing protein [Gemmatimonadaceae bacterium]|nr:DUF456 domain-containing protein [Gemmatimonadaceae bacterium]